LDLLSVVLAALTATGATLSVRRGIEAGQVTLTIHELTDETEHPLDFHPVGPGSQVGYRFWA
jgi:hypothetical protein